MDVEMHIDIETDSMAESLDEKHLTGRNRRLLYEWRLLNKSTSGRKDISCQVQECNSAGLPIVYLILYNIRSICGLENIDRLGEKGIINKPIFASQFKMLIEIPEGYPCIDAPVKFSFLTYDVHGKTIPHPWHPNIRYFGDMAGRVCLNIPDTYTDLAWCVERVAAYLRYDLYHAIQEPPYPEDLKVAKWVITQGEPKDWVFFEQEQVSQI
ncbi:MAG: hypothetical protein RR382_01125 [Tannerellaceae bacterium]